MQTSEVGKKALCENLKWSRPTLDRRLKADPNFPVLQRGGQGGGWKFNLIEVRKYLAGAGADFVDAGVPSSADDDDQDLVDMAQASDGSQVPADPIMPQRRTDHSGEATATQRLKNAQAAQVEDKLRRSRGELVEAAEAREVMQIVMAEFKAALTDLPGIIAKEFELSERAQHTMRLRFEQAQRSIAAKIRGRLSDA